ncbi:MAG TPA: hypothetical protein DIS90_08215 [Cytophagales bacterium]|nr:hypothetical protein [Cytophagales bacterium]HCR54121.1 hypothetical protein [Cytophagales bacterium]
MRHLATIAILFISAAAVAQAPVISAITPVETYPTNQVIITGSGFSATPAQLQVWFNQVKGSIVSSSEFSITVTVPPSARFGVLEVINLSTRLSARSSFKFSPYYSGTNFNPAELDAPLTFTGSNELFDICSCDLNADGKPDLAVTQFDNETDLIVLQNTSTVGSLSFNKLDKSNLASLNIGAPTEKITCADLNGDGKPELIATRSGATKNIVYVLPNTSAGTISFGAAVPLLLDIGNFARFVKVRDLDNDGKPEIIVTNSFNNQLYIFKNQSTGGVLNINPTPVKITVTGATTTYGLDVQDLDNDGLADLIVNQFQSNNIFVLKNQGGASFSFNAPVVITAPGTLNEVVTADINEDGRLDLITTNTFSNQVLVLLNTSTTSISFNTTITLTTFNGPWGVEVGDIDGDQDMDIIVANRNQTQLNIFRHNGNNTSPGFSNASVVTSNPTRNILVGDLDGDGKPEIAYSSFNIGTSTYKVEILRNKNCFVPVILNEGPLTICATQTIRLNSIPGIGVATYDWKESGVSQSVSANPFYDITTAGTYTVTATSESGNCVITSAAIVVTAGTGSVPSDPTITSNSPVCSGQNLQLNTAVTGVTYNWSGPNGFTSGVQNPLITNVTKANAGLYKLVVSDGTCSSNEATELVDIADLQNFVVTSSLPGNTICQGGSITLSVNSIGGHSYQWIKDGVDIGGQTGTTLNVTQDGVYKNRVTNISLGCSVITNEVTVIVLTPPVVAFTVAPTACTGTALSFTNQSTFDSRATVVYAWAFGDGAVSASASPTHNYTTAQNYNPSLTVSYSGVAGCSNVTSKSVAVVNATQPVITTSAGTICPGEQATLSVTGTFNSLTWSTSETGASVVINQPALYSVASVDANGCSSSAQITIGSNPVPTLTVTADKTSVIAGQSAQLDAAGADTYSWTPIESLNNPLIANPIATPDQTTTYTVEGTVTGGCTAQATITIEVNSDPGSLNIPNVFSPNGDGVNDLWIIPGIESFTECVISIFDKNGKRVYEKRGYQNDWNGTYNGQDVPQGTYYYVIGCPDQKPLTGHLLIGR